MESVYVLTYINTDTAALSETYGVYKSKEEAVEKLLELSNYRENENGELTQYMELSNEYESLDILREKVSNEMELVDVDIYRITKIVYPHLHGKFHSHDNMIEYLLGSFHIYSKI